MIATINDIPVYNAVLSDEECGMQCISLVEDPAVMSNFLAFDGHKHLMMYSVADIDEHKVLGVVMRADFPIYRRDNGIEYYIVYKAATIRAMAEKYLAEYRQNEVNLDHLPNAFVEGVQMTQWFIKDSAKGIAPAGFDDISDGSLFAEFHIHNEEVWSAIKDGTYKGFSLEGVFKVMPEKWQKRVNESVESLQGRFARIYNQIKYKNMSKVQRFFKALESALVAVQFGSVTTDKAVLFWDGEEDLKEGDAVFTEDEEGNRNPAEDGDYITEDGGTVKVADGIVAEIVDPEADAAPVAEEPAEAEMAEGEPEAEAEEPAAEGNDFEDRIAALEQRIADLENLLASTVEAMGKMSASEPAHKQFGKTPQVGKTGVKGLDNLSKYFM